MREFEPDCRDIKRECERKQDLYVVQKSNLKSFVSMGRKEMGEELLESQVKRRLIDSQWER